MLTTPAISVIVTYEPRRTDKGAGVNAYAVRRQSDRGVDRDRRLESGRCDLDDAQGRILVNTYIRPVGEASDFRVLDQLDVTVRGRSRGDKACRVKAQDVP